MPLNSYTDQLLSRQARTAEILDAETEWQLAHAWRSAGDEAALHRLITAYLRLAIAMAAKYRRYGAPMNDLIQEANVGLMKAASKFDPDRGVRFSSYAVWWIKASIQEYVMRNWSLVRTGSTGAQKALFFNLHRVETRLGREAAARGEVLDPHQLRALVAQEIGVSLTEVERMESRLSGSDASLNSRHGADEGGREWLDALEDEAAQAAEQFEDVHDRAQLREWLSAALGRLSARERYIVVERRLRERPRTLDSLGRELGLSKERIRQVEAAAREKMRKRLTAERPELAHFLH